MAQRNLWTDDEMIVVLDLYFKLPFGRLNRTTPEVKELAALMGRSDNSVALRLVNFAACDPYIINSGRTGMASGIGRCTPYFERFVNDKETLFVEAQRIRAELANKTIEQQLQLTPGDFVGKEREAVIRQRVNQSAFRIMILQNYENKCAVTGIDIPQLLVASHIVPWAHNESTRLDPENGICLSPLYDKLFDSGLIGIRDDYTIELSKELLDRSDRDYFDSHFKPIQDKPLNMPIEHRPRLDFIEYHHQNIFAAHN